MQKKNIVYVGRSIDGFIAGKNGELDWLEMVPDSHSVDMGYGALMEEIDAIVMGRTTFEVVLNFGIEWPYTKHVFVLSNSLKVVPENLVGKVSLLRGTPIEILEEIYSKGYYKLYIDGGSTVQSFLREDLVDELRLTTIPIVLGGGFPLFGDLDKALEFEHVESKVFLGAIVQDWYRRKR